MFDMSDRSNLKEDILKILEDYLKVPSFTNTKGETLVDGFFNEFVSSMDYFKKNPELFGQHKIPDDPLNRSVNYALLKGDKKDTVIFLHHSDIVNIDNYGEYKPVAFNPKELEKTYKENSSFLDEESLYDLNSEKWLFGRGTADMKAGGAIQLALLKHYSKDHEDKPNILLIAVPDEENLSLGMRTSISLLDDLKSRYDLNYKLIINSEPHQRINKDRGVISQGSIAKMNVFVHVKGVLAHAGKALEGLNPNGLIGRIASEIDLSEEFVDCLENEMSIPPSWVYLRDYKQDYDISFPTSSYGILNVLNFSDTPQQVLNKIKKICKKTSVEYLELINKKRKQFSDITGRDWKDFNFDIEVLSLSEFLTCEGIDKKDIRSYPEDIEKVLNSSSSPKIIIGLLPPYYPGVTNKNQNELYSKVNDFTKLKWDQEYDNRKYFTGISDLSYSQGDYDFRKMNDQMENMIGWKTTYDIPFEGISKLSIPCINVGPWGKDFHRPTERVYLEDLMERTPQIIDNLIKSI